MLHKLSNALGELYDIADEVPVDDCAGALFLALRKLVPFDGAAIGDSNGRVPCGLIPAGAHTFGLDASAEAAFAQLAADPVIRAFHASGLRTIAVDCAGPDLSLREQAAAHGLRHLLLSGSAQTSRHGGWMTLVRRGHVAFSEAECTLATAAWPHLARCLHTLRRRLLAELAQAHGPGVALLYPDGAIAAADELFTSLCDAEWHTGASAALPEHAAAAMLEHGEFTGRTLRMRLWRQHGFARCSATARTACDLLTRAERAVALRYASGESYKEIAIGLHVSENTVRTHLAHVYDKLGIHRKVELIHQIDRLH